MSWSQWRSRHRWLLALIVGVAVFHAWLTFSVAALMEDMQTRDTSSLKPMQATYVAELKLSDPPLLAPTRKAVKTRQHSPKRTGAAHALAASSPEIAPTPPAAASGAEPLVPVPLADATQDAALPEPQPAVSEADAASDASATVGEPFVWPVATRVSYKVRGYFRGDVHGNATVEWVRKDLDYQVRVKASIGPSFAPIGSWNLISAGAITTDGLSPKRFEQIDRLLIRSSPPRTVVFEDDKVVLDSGERFDRQPNMQDASSQFIQLAYQFIMNPKMLTPGNTIYLPLALPKRVETIAYDVVEAQIIDTPIGKVPTFHVKPRNMSTDGGVLPVEIWFAPGLQYLPVRILVHGKDAASYMDMQMERAPEQTATEADAAARATSSN